MCSEFGLHVVCSNSVPKVGMLFTFRLCGGILYFVQVVRTPVWDGQCEEQKKNICNKIKAHTLLHGSTTCLRPWGYGQMKGFPLILFKVYNLSYMVRDSLSTHGPS